MAVADMEAVVAAVFTAVAAGISVVVATRVSAGEADILRGAQVEARHAHFQGRALMGIGDMAVLHMGHDHMA